MAELEKQLVGTLVVSATRRDPEAIRFFRAHAFAGLCPTVPFERR